jgi:hypothetical protein
MDTGEVDNVLNADLAAMRSDQMLSSCDPMHVPGSDSSATRNFGQPQLVIGQRLKSSQMDVKIGRLVLLCTRMTRIALV